MKKCSLIIMLIITVLIVSGCTNKYIERWPKEYKDITYYEDGTCGESKGIEDCSYTRDSSNKRIINVEYTYNYTNEQIVSDPFCIGCVRNVKHSDKVTKTLYIDDDGALIEYKDNTEYIQAIDLNKLSSIFNSSNESVIYVGRSGCSPCDDYKTALEELLPKYKLNVYYINTDKINLDEFEKVIGIKPERVPTTYIVKNKEIKDTLEGYSNKDQVIEFFQKNEIIN